MGLIHTDSFKRYDTAANLTLGGYASPTNISFGTSSPRYTGQRYAVSSGSNSALNRGLGSNLGTMYGGCSVKVTGTTNYPVVRFLDGTTVQASIYYNGTTGKFLIYRGDASSLLGTSSGTYAANTWHVIEWLLQINSSISANQGRLFINANPTADIDLTAATDTNSNANNYANVVGLFGNSSNSQIQIGDFYLRDDGIFGYGPQIRVIKPSGNGNTNDFINSDSNSTNNYLYVDDDQFQVATYVQSGTPGDKDLYSFEDLPFSPAAIGGIGIHAYMIKTSSGARTARLITRSGGTDYEGGDITLAETPVSYSQYRDVDPDTTSAWTESDLNSAQFGVKVEA